MAPNCLVFIYTLLELTERQRRQPYSSVIISLQFPSLNRFFALLVCNHASKKAVQPKTLQEFEVHLENELSEREVAGVVGVSRGVIQNVIRRLQNGSSDYKRRPGRGRKTTTRTDRHIEFAVLRDRQVTLRELQADLTVVTGQPVSHSLISRRLSEKGLNARRPRKNPH